MISSITDIRSLPKNKMLDKEKYLLQSVAAITDSNGANIRRATSGRIALIFKRRVMLRVAFKVSVKYTVIIYP